MNILNKQKLDIKHNSQFIASLSPLIACQSLPPLSTDC